MSEKTDRGIIMTNYELSKEARSWGVSIGIKDRNELEPPVEGGRQEKKGEEWAIAWFYIVEQRKRQRSAMQVERERDEGAGKPRRKEGRQATLNT